MTHKRLIVAGVIITAVTVVASIALLTSRSGAPPAAPLGQLHWAETPQPVPTIAFSDEFGSSHTLQEFAGRVLVVNFWATWCAPCVREMPSLDALQASLGGDAFTVLAINQDREGVEVARPFLADHGWSHLKLYTDERSQLVNATHVRGLPTSLIIDRQGREVARLEGTAAWDGPEMAAVLRKLMAEP